MGPIAVEGATGRLDSNRRRRGIELAAYLALNPGVDHHAIDDALWPGQVGNKQMRNSVISRTRSWLDKDPDGNAHFPRVQDTGDNRYRLGPNVTCDWTTFQKHARKGLADQGEDGDLALRRALALVRGRPFTGIDPGRYAWAEPAVQEMVSAITHVAYELSTRRREADVSGDIPSGQRTLETFQERANLLACQLLCSSEVSQRPHSRGIQTYELWRPRAIKVDDAPHGGLPKQAVRVSKRGAVGEKGGLHLRVPCGEGFRDRSPEVVICTGLMGQSVVRQDEEDQPRRRKKPYSLRELPQSSRTRSGNKDDQAGAGQKFADDGLPACQGEVELVSSGEGQFLPRLTDGQ